MSRRSRLARSQRAASESAAATRAASTHRGLTEEMRDLVADEPEPGDDRHPVHSFDRERGWALIFPELAPTRLRRWRDRRACVRRGGHWWHDRPTGAPRCCGCGCGCGHG